MRRISFDSCTRRCDADGTLADDNDLTASVLLEADTPAEETSNETPRPPSVFMLASTFVGDPGADLYITQRNDVLTSIQKLIYHWPLVWKQFSYEIFKGLYYDVEICMCIYIKKCAYKFQNHHMWLRSLN
jgi:hypothetical protein